MPIRFQFLAADYDVHTVFAGRVTIADLESYFDEIVADKRFVNCKSEIVEMRDVEFVGFDYDSIAAFADRVGAYEGTLTATALVSAEPLPYGLARMYQSLRDDGERFQVFDDMDEATAWLRRVRDARGSA